jgi:hypothetical protein
VRRIAVSLRVAPGALRRRGCFFAAPCTENPSKISILPHSAYIAFHAGRRAFVFRIFHFQNGTARGHSLGSVGPMGHPEIAAKLAGAFVPARVAAANAIWGRPYGKPEQTTINYNETLDGFTDDEISGFLAALRADLGPEAGDVKSVGTPPGKARKPQEAERGSGRPH